MGILLMNIAAFALPFAAYDNPAAYGGTSPLDLAVWAAEFVLVDGKMRALFSALFGASLLLIADRAEAAGRSATAVHYARMATLLLFGLVHACLIWTGDILMLYALVGMVAFAFRRLPVDRLLVLALLLLMMQAAILGLHYQSLAALGDAARQTGAGPADVALWHQVLDQIGRPSPAALQREIALHRGSWLVLTHARIAAEPGAVGIQLLFDGPETLGLMLLGMAGLRTGFLAGGWQGRSYLTAASRLYALALPPMIVMAAILLRQGFPPLLTTVLVDLAAMPLRWLLAAAHAALLMAWLTGPSSHLKARVAATGRAAFTNYLGTSIVMAALFDGWGLGLYARLDRWMLLPIVLAAWGAMLVWSRPWLGRFSHGPFERAWRLSAHALLRFTHH